MCESDVCVEKPGADEDDDASSAASNDEDAGAVDSDEDDTDTDEVDSEAADSEEEDPAATDEELTDADTSAASDDGEDTDPGEEPDPTPEQQQLEDGSVGSACGRCDTNLTCVDGVPGGYCTAECLTHEDCGALGACVGYVCYRACEADADCRPDYACADAGEVQVCDVGGVDETGSDTGSCALTCEHYLSCKGIFDEETQLACETNCESSGYSSEDLAAFQATDCETAIYVVEGPPSSGGGGSVGGGADCTGCQWDGSSCVYLSQYTLVSTAGFTCDASCCN